jgi:NAD(P)-dependent dehydrogenase (short-subunit alcohol dehydrogenase family)
MSSGSEAPAAPARGDEDAALSRTTFDLSGRAAVVTGGCGILGRRFCRGLLEAGAAVAIVDLGEEDTAQVAADLRNETGGRAVGLAADLRDPAAVAAMVERAEEELGPLRVLISNAATKSSDPAAFFAPYESYSLETWREVTAVNLDAMFLVSQAAGRAMLAHGRGGSIIQTSSIYGVVAPDQRIYEGSEYEGRAINTPAVYAATKAAVVGLTKYLATYWAERGIRVNTLAPGGVASGQNAAFRERYSARVPMGRMAEAGELMGTVLYLASDASSYVTGQTLVVDGGLTAW